ncbi:prephenate dehydratase domain-containing protein [Soonwooa sp.]
MDAHYKNIAKQDFSSTAAAAKHVSENPDRKLAAVANQFAAKLYDL